MTTRGRKTDIDQAELCEAWADKRFTLLELGVRFGCSGETVANHARRLGLPPRSRGRRTRPPVDHGPYGPPLEGGQWVPNHRGIQVWCLDPEDTREPDEAGDTPRRE